MTKTPKTKKKGRPIGSLKPRTGWTQTGEVMETTSIRLSPFAKAWLGVKGNRAMVRDMIETLAREPQ